MKIKYLLLATVIVTAAQAENLYDVINSSIKASPTVNRQIKFYDGVLQDLEIAKSDNLPTLDYQGEIGRDITKRDGIGDARLNYWKNNLTLRQNLFRGYKTQSEIRQNEARISEAAYTVLDRANTAALSTTIAYLNVLKEYDLTKLFEKDVQNHNDILAKIKERTEAGVGKESEVQQTQSRLSLAYSNLIVQQNNFQDTLTEYHFNVGRHYDQSEYLKPTLEYQLPENVDKAAYIALLNNPSVKALKSSIIAKVAEHEKAGSEFYPILDAVASQDWEKNADGTSGRRDGTSIGLVARWNLYRGGADEAGRVKALEALTEERRNLRRIQRDVIRQARLSYTAYNMLLPQIGYLEDHVNKSEDTLASYNEEYSLGRRDLIAILDAQKEFITAKQILTRTEYDLLIAKYRVASSTSELLKEVKSDLPSKLLLTSIEEDLTDDENFARNVLCDNPLNRENLNEYDCKENTKVEVGYIPLEALAIVEVPEVVVPEVIPVVEPIAPAIIKLSNVNFDIDSYDISPKAEDILKDNVEKLNEKKDYTLQLFGHTDSSGNAVANEILSKNRAMSTKNKLLELGANLDQVEIHPMGQNSPIVENNSVANKALNRRVELKIVDKEQ